MNILQSMTAILVVITLVSFAGASAVVQNDPVQTKSFKVSKGGALEVSLNVGDIRVVPWEKSEVLVKVRGVDEEEFNQLDITATVNSVEIDGFSGDWSSESRLEITVPSSFRVDVKTSSGNILVEGPLSGIVKATTSGGDIDVGDINGSVKARTSGGNVHVGDIRGDIDVKTSGGDISVGTVGGSVQVNTAGGNIQLGSVKGSLQARSSGGDVRVPHVGVHAEVVTLGGNIAMGTVGGGATLTTAGGDIDLEEAHGVVGASTGGGNLRLSDIEGSIMANTGGGDVTIELVPSGSGNSMIITGNGLIRLFMPENAGATIEARVYISEQWDYDRETYGVHSEFRSQDYQKYEEKKERRMKIVLNGGGQKITLQTTDSDIEIRKMKPREK